MSIGDSPEQQQLQDQHHHDVAESAAAFAASIALAGVGIGTDGDLNSHHAEADSAAVEAAVAAALAATDAKSNSYHHHLSPTALDPDLLEHHVVHGSNDPLEPPDTADTPTASAEGGMVPGLGLALDAAAKLAAAAATLPSDEAVPGISPSDTRFPSSSSRKSLTSSARTSSAARPITSPSRSP